MIEAAKVFCLKIIANGAARMASHFLNRDIVVILYLLQVTLFVTFPFLIYS